MKKVLLLVSVVTLLTSCYKEENEPCNCGMIVSDEVKDYSIVIRNGCSGNEKRFYLQEGDWFNAHPGNDYCITNVNNW